MEVAVFGGTGFVGKAVCALLKERSMKYVCISRSATGLESCSADITNSSSLDAIPFHPKTIIICSATLPALSYSDSDISLFVEGNITAIGNILRWAKQRKVSRIIYCSTLSMVPAIQGKELPLIDTDAHYLYKVSKAAGEHLLIGYCKQNDIEYYSLRIASVYGPGMKKDVLHIIYNKIQNHETFVINNSNVTVDFIHVNDVALAIVSSIADKSPNRIINISSGERISLQSLADTMSRLLGIPIKTEIRSYTPIPSIAFDNTALKLLVGRPLVDLDSGFRQLFNDNQHARLNIQ